MWVSSDLSQPGACGTAGCLWGWGPTLPIAGNSFQPVTYIHFCSALTQILILLMQLNGVRTNYICNDASF